MTLTTASPAAPAAPPADLRRAVLRGTPLVGGMTLLVGYLSIVVLIPIAALAAHGLGVSIQTHGAGLRFWEWSVHSDLSRFWSTVTQPEALHAIWLSLALSLGVATVNAAAGVAIAWILVRDRFVGQRVVEAVIDLPFALPTIVAGVVLLFLYGPASPVHVDLLGSWIGLAVALLFVTLPLSVRAVQPVLQSLDGHAEAAARSLGASRFGAFRTIVLPSLMPAVLSGFGLAFARAIGEVGSILLIAGGFLRTMPASLYILQLMGGGPLGQVQAASVSVALLVLSLALLATSASLSRRIGRRLTA